MNVEKIVNSIIAKTPELLFNQTIDAMKIKSLITQEARHLTINLCAGFPSQWLETYWLPGLQKALEQALPDYRITILIDQFIKAHRTQLVGKGLRGIKNTIAIASGKGGVGKSTVTTNLAVALANMGARVGILDADIYGPSQPTMLGASAGVELLDDRYLPIKAHGIQAMSIGYLTQGDSALLWRGPMLAKSLIQMIDITAWDDLDYLLIDLPPGTGDIQLSLVQKIPLTAAVIVTTPQQIATLDAEKGISLFARTGIHLLGIIENMSTHQCTQCGYHDNLFGSGGAERLCQEHQCKLLGQLPLDSRIGQHSDQGLPVTAAADDALSLPFTKAALQLAIELSHRPLNYAETFPPIQVETTPRS